ncbi:hypothetical protein F2Q70_00029498 [Brassica cretica]|uniref:Uncharacterized protein n=1 Tax=Brassica cretica TaxID=69181 RepID=A0A8S9FDW2_BRACR|nr:hypothetical protein F2Q70_00029498 [Brassica cretica]
MRLNQMEDSSTALEKMLAAENLFCLKQNYSLISIGAKVGVESERDWCRVFVFQAPIGEGERFGGSLCKVESQALETNSGGDVRRHNQQVSGKQDVKGKGIAYEGGKQAAGAKLGPGRRHRDQGRSMTRYVRQAGYLPP